MDAFIVIFLFVAGLALFISEKLSVDVVTLILLTVLILTGILTPAEAFAGFAGEVIVILACVFVICGGLLRSGILENLVTLLLKLAGRGERGLISLLMAISSVVSAFMNNTTVTGMLLPAVDGVAQRARISTSKLMMPLAFGSILGGTCTLIGTSTNLAVSGYIEKTGLPPIGLFELTPIGLIIAGVGTLYMIFIGIRLLPAHAEERVTPTTVIRDYLCEIEVLPASPLIGEKASDWELGLIGFRIVQIIRGNRAIPPGRQAEIHEGDVLLVKGRVDQLTKIQKIEGIRFRTQLDLDELTAKGKTSVSEILILPGADIVGKTLAETDFARRFGVMVLAINREEQQFVMGIQSHPLAVGDVLLVKGSRSDFQNLKSREPSLHNLGTLSDSHPATWQGWALLGCFITAIFASSLADVPLAAGFLATAIIAILTGCITADKARESIDWRLLILIGGMTAFGLAMEKSGSAQWIADGVIAVAGPLGPIGVMTGFIILTIILTQPMSNAAAALVIVPIAIKTAEQIGAEPRTFAIAVMLAASISFITPFEPSCLLVYGPGHYRFRDFVIVGGGLTVLLLLIVVPLIPVFWQLTP